MSDSYWSKPPSHSSLSVGAVIRHALQFSAVAALAAAGTAAGAADTAASDQTLQEVVVTGSYIPRTDSETPSPVSIITSADIEHSGLTSLADVVRTLSADNSGTLPTAFNGAFAAGASGIALRGLTVNSTLVLIDGLRGADYALPDDGVRSFSRALPPVSVTGYGARTWLVGWVVTSSPSCCPTLMKAAHGR